VANKEMAEQLQFFSLVFDEWLHQFCQTKKCLTLTLKKLLFIFGVLFATNKQNHQS